MDEFLDEMDDEQVDDLLQPEEGEDKAPQLYEHFRFVADRGQSLLRVDKFLVDRMFGATRNSRCRLYHGKRQTGEKQLPGETGGCCDNYDDTTSADFRDSP